MNAELPPLAEQHDVDKTALSYWFPLIEAAGLPVPRTIILDMPIAAQEDVWAAFEGKPGRGALKEFADLVATAGGIILRNGPSDPFFLRTDHTSGKHQWKGTCCVTDPSLTIRHILAIAEFSEICDFMGLPYNRWAVREFLPIKPVAECPRYGDMPVNREFRFFVDDGVIRCVHPYWPEQALLDGGAHGVSMAQLSFESLNFAEMSYVMSLAVEAGKACAGSWSIDILEADRGYGWFITDMAEARKSFHWEGCAHAGK